MLVLKLVHFTFMPLFCVLVTNAALLITALSFCFSLSFLIRSRQYMKEGLLNAANPVPSHAGSSA